MIVPALVGKAKAVVRSMPWLYKAVFPFVALVCRVRVRALKAKIQRGNSRLGRHCEDLPKLVPAPMFVKVGANDGITADPCSDVLLANVQWHGLLIEPVPYCFERLRENFRDPQRFSLAQVCIGATADSASFYYVDEKAIDSLPHLPPGYDQLGAFDRSHIVESLDGVLEPFIIECAVSVCGLSDVIRKNGIEAVHLLHVDTEGHDLEVLKTLDFAEHAPTVIFIEHRHLPRAQRQEMRRLLRRHGYSVRDCGFDYLAVNRTAMKRLQRAAANAAE